MIFLSTITSVISKQHENVSRYKNNCFIETWKIKKLVSKHIFKTKSNIKMINDAKKISESANSKATETIDVKTKTELT